VAAVFLPQKTRLGAVEGQPGAGAFFYRFFAPFRRNKKPRFSTANDTANGYGLLRGPVYLLRLRCVKKNAKSLHHATKENRWPTISGVSLKVLF
jgi:hypothetical protein